MISVVNSNRLDIDDRLLLQAYEGQRPWIEEWNSRNVPDPPDGRFGNYSPTSFFQPQFTSSLEGASSRWAAGANCDYGFWVSPADFTTLACNHSRSLTPRELSPTLLPSQVPRRVFDPLEGSLSPVPRLAARSCPKVGRRGNVRHTNRVEINKCPGMAADGKTTIEGAVEGVDGCARGWLTNFRTVVPSKSRARIVYRSLFHAERTCTYRFWVFDDFFIARNQSLLWPSAYFCLIWIM